MQRCLQPSPFALGSPALPGTSERPYVGTSGRQSRPRRACTAAQSLTAQRSTAGHTLPASVAPARPGLPRAWGLADVVPCIVRSCLARTSSSGSSPLHLVVGRAGRMEVQPVMPPTAGAEDSIEYWHAAAQQAQEADAEAVILVRPIPSETCCCLRPHECSALCCESSLPGSSPSVEHHRPSAAATPSSSHPAPSEFIDGTRFFGMVVQSKPGVAASRSNSGCYVLKLSRLAGSGDAPVSHFSLTKVCASSSQQLYNSWRFA